MRFNKIKKICIVLTLMGICFLSSFRAVDSLKCDYQAPGGGYFETYEKASFQSWEEYWQSFIDNPNRSNEYIQKEARWVIANGLSSKSPEEVGQAWLDAGEPGYINNSAVSPIAVPNESEKDNKDDNRKKVDNVEKIPEANSLNTITEKEEWVETAREDATCTEVGKVTYTEQNSGKTKTETIAAVGHAKGKAEITTQPTLFNKGEQVIKCTRCGEVLESKVLPAKVPMRIWGILFTSAVVLLIAITIFIKAKKRKK
jgi:hypothetical protein